MNVVNVTNKKDLHILSSGMQLFAIDGETEKAYLLKIRGEWVPNHDHPKSISKLLKMRKPGTLRKLHVKITPLTNTFRKRHLEEEQQLFVCLFTGRSRVSISGPETPTEWKSESVTNQPTDWGRCWRCLRI